MNSLENAGQNRTTRREFLKTSTKAVAGAALAAAIARPGYAAENNTIKVALVGCGGRGTGAVENAISSKGGPIKLVAMADVFANRLAGSYQQLTKNFAAQVDVPEDRRFVGFDAYQKAMDCLSPGDIAIFATPPGFRWVHFGYAVKKGLNVFMEKPVTVDGPSTRKLLKLADEAQQKNLKVGVGLMSRHSRALEQLSNRIQDGEIGDLILMRGYRVHGPVGSAFSTKWPGNPSELLWQIQHFHSFLWASGGCYSDFNIHIIDHICWMKGAWPVNAQALGGRHYRQNADGTICVDQNFDVYAVEYTFADGAKFLLEGRCIAGCHDIYSSYAHGTKGLAIVSKSGDCGMPSSTYKGQNADPAKLLWTSEVSPEERNPYQNEWNDLIDAIRNDKYYNEAKRGAQASLVTSLGRMAAHTGRLVTYDEILNLPHEFAPEVDQLTMSSPPPLQSDADGKYPIPQPGKVTDREY